MSVAASAAATGADASASLVEKAGCWDCQQFVQIFYCQGGNSVGFWNCWVSWTGCNRSSSGCGGSASIPVDLDGAAQYVSRSMIRPLPAVDTPPAPVEERNCDGVVVARQQSPDNIAAVRTRTAVLFL